MSKATKIWLIIAALLILIGCIILGGVMVMLKWDFTKLSTTKYETNHYEINENYTNLSIVTNTADVVLVPSEIASCSVVCHEQSNVKQLVTAKDGTLVIEVVDSRKWYEHLGIHFGTPKITVYIPRGEYGELSISSDTGNVEIQKEFRFESMDISVNTGDVTSCASASKLIKIKTSTGDIGVDSLSAGALDLSVTTGKVTVSSVSCEGDISVGVSTGKSYLTDVTCKSLTTTGNTGGISLNNVIAAEKISIKRTTGNVKLGGSDAAAVFVETDTGNVTGTLLSEKVFIARSSTGKVDVPKTSTGGRCEITTGTGNIKLEIQN